MAVNPPLNEMSVEEKLQAMEAIWMDLSREPDRIESPPWHKDVLEETERRVESGEATFSDWEKGPKIQEAPAGQDLRCLY
jgi:hypothetical protein